MGFDYFQGYFFAKPTMMKHNDIDYNYGLVVAIYAEIMSPNPDLTKIAALFELDAALAYKLLRLINSGVFPIQSKIALLEASAGLFGPGAVKKVC